MKPLRPDPSFKPPSYSTQAEFVRAKGEVSVFCAKCGNGVVLPFTPTPGREYLCGRCYKKSKSEVTN